MEPIRVEEIANRVALLETAYEIVAVSDQVPTSRARLISAEIEKLADEDDGVTGGAISSPVGAGKLSTVAKPAKQIEPAKLSVTVTQVATLRETAKKVRDVHVFCIFAVA